MRLGVVVASCGLALTSVASAQMHVIGPGQEELLGEALNGEPAAMGDCRLEGASVDRNVVEARYACAPPAGAVTVMLFHPDDAPEVLMRTERFAIDGDHAPAALLDAIAARLLERESAFEWRRLAEPLPPRVSPDDSLLDALRHRNVLIVAIGWLLLAGFVVVYLPRTAARHRADFALATAASAAALLLRLAVPWGPLDFAEAERIEMVWMRGGDLAPSFASLAVLLDLLRRAGMSLHTIARFAGPVLGALSVAAVYALARSCGASRRASLLGALLVLALPAHVRYSGSVPLTIAGGGLLCAAAAVATARDPTERTRVFFVAPALVLLAFMRPEYVVLLPAFALFGSRSRFRARTRVVIFALVAAAVVPHAIEVARYSGPALGRDANWLGFARFALLSPSSWPIAIGALGLVAGAGARRARAGLLVATFLLGLVYVTSAGEHNPLLGHWRYTLSLVPMLAVGTALLAERARRRFSRTSAIAIPALALVVCLTPAAEWRQLLRPIDAQTDFHYARASVPRILRAHSDIVVVGDEGDGSRMETIPLFALAVALGPVERPRACGAVLESSPRIWSSSALLAGCVPEDEGIALYLGAYRPPGTLEALRARFDLVPIEERTIRTAPALQHYDTQCPLPNEVFVGDALEDCALRVGWYRPVAVGPARR